MTKLHASIPPLTNRRAVLLVITAYLLSSLLTVSSFELPSASPQHYSASQTTNPVSGDAVNSKTNRNYIQRRLFLSQLTLPLLLLEPSIASSIPLESINGEISSSSKPFHSTATGREEYTNSIIASRDTNISPREVYDTISSNYLKSVLEGIKGREGRALDVGAGAGVSTEVLYQLGYHRIDAIDWSGTAWERYVIDDPSGYCPPSVSFYELDDERYLDAWKTEHDNDIQEGLFDAIVFNFAVNESKAKLFATQLLNKQHGVLLAPINTANDYWLKQNYKVMNSMGDVLWSTGDVGAWSVQFQPDVTQDTCSGVWCAPFNGFQKKK